MKYIYIKLTGLLIFFVWLSGINAVGQTAIPDSTIHKKARQEDTPYSVRGKIVSDATNAGFAGVRISVVNTRLTTMTEDDGTFEIKVPHLESTLSVDAPGYQDQIVGLKGRSEVNIRILGQTQDPFYNETVFETDAILSTSSFSPEIVSIDQDITSRLNGNIRSVSHSGLAGSGAAIFVRGLNSLNTSSQPLYVIDGVVWQMPDEASIHAGFFNNPLAFLDPNDVAKITVQKDGTSIYGSKGGNGVIFIETKRSRTMATDISAYVSMGYRSPLKSLPVMDAESYRLYVSDVLSGKYENTTAVDKFRFLDDDPSKSYYKANHNNTDWLGLINDAAWTQNYGISVKGGDEVALYAFSLGYNKNDGNIENTDFNRLNVRFNSDINISEKLKLAFDIAFAQVTNNVYNDGVDSISAPVFMSSIKSPLYNPYQYDRYGNLSNYLSDVDELGIGNPLAMMDKGFGFTKTYRFNANLRPTYTFNEKVKATLLIAYAWDKLNEDSFKPDYGTTDLPLSNAIGEIYDYSRNTARDRMDRHSSLSIDAHADWKIMQNSIHNLQLYGGYRFFSDTYEAAYGIGHNTSSDFMTDLSNTTASLRYSTGLDDNWKSMAWYANADYSFKNRYLLQVAAAMDASSLFGTDVNKALNLGGLSWGFFPSVSAGWILSSENFMKGMDAINFLKLTVGYGLSGNDKLPKYANRTYFSSVKFMGTAAGIQLANIGNNQLKWETTGTAKIGLDVSLFNNRWDVSANVYTAKTKDLLTRKPLNEKAGLLYFWSNDGEIQNKGLEVETNIRVLNMRDWKLDFGGMIGHYKNKVLSLANGSFITDVYGAQILTTEQSPAGVFYGYKTKGVFSTVEDATAARLAIRSVSGALTPFAAGDMRFDDLSKDNIIDENDKQVIGDPNPDFYGNFNFSLAYKQLSLSALFTYSYGNDAYNALRASLEAGSNAFNQSTTMQNRWVANGQATSIPRATYGDPMGNSRFSDRWIEDASFVKFKSLSLSYKLPLNLPFLQEITVWGAVDNIYTFTKYLGLDPEFAYGNSVLYQGIDPGLTPSTRTFNAGVKINL